MRSVRWRIKDSRAQVVTQVDPVVIQLLHQDSVIDEDTLRAITAEEGVRVGRTERAALIVSVCTAGLVILLFGYSLVIGDLGSARLAKSASLLYFCTVAWIIWFALKRKRFRHVASAMLKHHRCPHCGYDLQQLPIDPSDGATVCPECGCAWMLIASDLTR